MIVSAHSFSVSRAATDRAAGAAAVAPAETGPGQDAPDALARLDDFVEQAALSRKAFAEDRLKHLKEQMNTLSLFNLAPGFLAGHAARMASELESAARDFATSFRTLANRDEARTSGPSLPPAYLDVMDGEIGSGMRLTADDAETTASFIHTAQHLTSVVDMASEGREERADVRRTADNARIATARVVSLMARLEGPSAFARTFW